MHENFARAVENLSKGITFLEKFGDEHNRERDLIERSLRALEMTAGEDFQQDTIAMLRDYLGWDKAQVAVAEPRFSPDVERAFDELCGDERKQKEILQRLYDRGKDTVFHGGQQWPKSSAAGTLEDTYREGVEDGRTCRDMDPALREVIEKERAYQKSSGIAGVRERVERKQRPERDFEHG